MSSASSASAAAGQSRRVVRVAPPSSLPQRWLSFDVKSLWDYRELLAYLVLRDVKVRYKQTALGSSWAILRPIATMVVFTVVFGNLLNLQSGATGSYPIFVFAALLPWTYFTTALTMASGSVVGNANLITKVHFPRIIMPLYSVAVPLVDFVPAVGVLLLLMAWYGQSPSTRMLLLFPFLLVAVIAALGAGLLLSAVNVRYRDVSFAIPFATQAWMYATPIIYPISIVPERWRWILSLNPLTGVVVGSRWAVTGKAPPSSIELLEGIVAAIVLLFLGLVLFKGVERRFADVI